MSQGIVLKSPKELAVMDAANHIVADTLALLEKNIEPGISTLALDQMAEEYCRREGGLPAFKGYRGYPKSLCVSINEEVVHGIPSRKVVIREGDIVSIDFGVKLDGFYGDSAVTVAVGEIGELKEKLISVTRTSLEKGVALACPGNRVKDISAAVQGYVEKNGFSVVRQFVGHGIGSRLHEPPEIPNYARRERTARLLPGMVLAIEPMVNAGTYEVEIQKDGWTVVTRDRQPSAHFEYSVAVTENGPVVLGRNQMADLLTGRM